jgi:arylsulfatase A-like enzyme
VVFLTAFPMRHRKYFKTGAIIGVLLVLAACCTGGIVCLRIASINTTPPRTPRPPRPQYPEHNLVFVSFDALQGRHCGHLGYSRKVTPTLDAMAADGIVFTRAYSVASWTVPASMTWFTGVYPSEHRVVNKFSAFNDREKRISNLKDLAPNVVTLADVLKANGYATAGFTGNAGVSGGFGYQQGFDVYEHPQGVFGGFDQSLPKALDWVKENKEKKFFLFLHGYDAHGQNTPAEGFDYWYVEKGYDRRYTGAEVEQEALREEGLERGKLKVREQDVQFWRAVYDEKVERADAKFRKFLDEYEKLGLMDKTVFVLTADHGTELFEHDRLDHGFTLYDETLHVPLVIKPPGKEHKQRVETRVSSIDVMPTVLDLLGVSPPPGVEKQMRGKSLIDVAHANERRFDLFAETDYRQHTYKRAIITDDGWKLIVTLEDKTRELYDTTNDPGEKVNRAEALPERADGMQRRLFAHFKDIGQDLTARKWERGFNPVYTFPAKPSPRE